jgi:hypothetical protein
MKNGDLVMHRVNGFGGVVCEGKPSGLVIKVYFPKLKEAVNCRRSWLTVMPSKES